MFTNLLELILFKYISYVAKHSVTLKDEEESKVHLALGFLLQLTSSN